MVFQKETRFGLTFGQVLSLIGIAGGILLAWVSINVRIAQAEIRIDELEKGQVRNATTIETIRSENRDDHKAILNAVYDLKGEISKIKK